ncbi:MAG: hypothetical protein OQK51_04445 [Kangiellaceae bacterium]|nr:hypothetical protein [Kangiellaceae bacterium]
MRYFISLVVALFSSMVHSTEKLQAYTDIPQGWRTEIISFPLSFAPEISINGIEELVFSPGMYKKGEQDFFSYAFVWIDNDNSIKPEFRSELIKQYLIAYYEGLHKAVAETEHAEVVVSLSEFGEAEMSGEINWIEPFVTKSDQLINFKVNFVKCNDEKASRWYFIASPQVNKHPIWKSLESLKKTKC